MTLAERVADVTAGRTVRYRGNDRAVYELAADAARLCGAGAPLVDSTMIYETYQQRDQVAV